jgi:hypothetical protein
MNLTISDEVRRETERCPHDMSCLSTGNCGSIPMCAVESRLDNKLLFVDEKKDTVCVSCPYTFAFGYGRICTCPTRESIYLQQHKKAA